MITWQGLQASQDYSAGPTYFPQALLAPLYPSWFCDDDYDADGNVVDDYDDGDDDDDVGDDNDDDDDGGDSNDDAEGDIAAMHFLHLCL